MAGWLFAGGADWPAVRSRMAVGGPLAGPPRGVRVVHSELDGVPCEILTPPGGTTDTALLYLHGGGFAIGSAQTHRSLTGHLAVAMNATVYALNYRLAPENPYPAANDDCLAAYRALLARGIPAARIVVAGDSAGGALSLDLALRASAQGLPGPAALGLICPVLDLSAESSVFTGPADREPLLTAALMRRFLDAYLPDMSQRVRRELSPLHRELAGLPPIVLQTAEDDPLHGDALRLADRLRDSVVPLGFRSYPGLWHAFHAVPMMSARARAALDELAAALTAAGDAPRR
ncbi:alpha/beta hydrolase [Nocardia sp. NPDC051832]|uniref:alpha/beta hydrolase n=1 Tax=Nocardia sp. NPDC051832 TaxID=3155673 RepID=UPI00341C6C05